MMRMILKPGQLLSLSTGEFMDQKEGGQIQIGPSGKECVMRTSILLAVLAGSHTLRYSISTGVVRQHQRCAAECRF